jgi:CBS domain-containing protein
VRQTTVAHVMTCNPVSVQSITARNEALNIMVARRFRHLPVISSSSNNINRIDTTPSSRLASSSPSPTPSYHTDTVGTGNTSTNVVGLLDITKCVFERLDELERKVNEDGNIVKAMDALERRGAVASDHAGAIKALHAGCPDLLSVLTGGISSTTADAKLALSGEDPAAVVFDEEVPQVTVRASVREAARAMKEFHHTAVLVVANGSTDKDDRLGGIFTTKDIVLRVIAAGLDPITTSVIRVMTPHPDSVSTDTTILEALKKLHGKFHLKFNLMRF